MQVVVVADATEGEELRLEAVLVVVGVAAGVAHGREKGILGGGARQLPHGRRLEVEDGNRRRFLVLLHTLVVVELEKPVVVVLLLLLLICLLLSPASSSSYAAAVAAVGDPVVVVPRIQIPRRLLPRRYCCCSNARPSTSPDPITRRGVGD
ncbi:Os01g0214001 [Oryza sativa Japonica Group]|uniref:Os01g0214001 protein n=1 Tax=Oryza sativa subsp. japonica TaxID=39947 RepID=A0A0P0UZK6_ORYSJ|nr:Os01g0214001 [Oryza sativa Japonica Group]